MNEILEKALSLTLYIRPFNTLFTARISTRGMRRFSFDGLRFLSKHRKLKEHKQTYKLASIHMLDPLSLSQSVTSVTEKQTQLVFF